MSSSKRQGQKPKWSWRGPEAGHCPHSAPSDLHSAAPSIVLDVKIITWPNTQQPEKSDRHHDPLFASFICFNSSALWGLKHP